MAHWIRIAAVSDVVSGTMLEAVAGERIVALANVDGSWYALDGVCPHQGGPLGKGELQGSTLTCPWHGWQFDVCTGQHCLSQTIRQPSFPVKVEGDGIYVDIGQEPAD